MKPPVHSARWSVALLLSSLIALGWTALETPPPRVVYNASDSVPIGWYLISPAGSLVAGDLVLARLPGAVRVLAARRGYLPAGVPLLKTVAAVRGQRVCAQDPEIRIDDRLVTQRLGQDRQGRPLPAWQGCRRLQGTEVFLLSTSNPESFDSRYFGPISASAVIGVAQPLWLEDR